MKLHFTHDWLRSQIESDPDIENDAGLPVLDATPLKRFVKPEEQNRDTGDVQGSFFEDGRMVAPARPSTPDPQAIRERLGRLLETLREAESMPLSDKDVRMWRIVVPNMTRWLPDDEANAIRSEFTREMERLGS